MSSMYSYMCPLLAYIVSQLKNAYKINLVRQIQYFGENTHGFINFGSIIYNYNYNDHKCHQSIGVHYLHTYIVQMNSSHAYNIVNCERD